MQLSLHYILMLRNLDQHLNNYKHKNISSILSIIVELIPALLTDLSKLLSYLTVFGDFKKRLSNSFHI